MYLSYADIGFLNSGQKFASEAYSNGEKEEEIKILGFTGSILLFMFIPFSIGMIFFSYNPEILFRNIGDNEKVIITKLLLIIAIFTPLQIILERLVQSILVIRIKDYISLKIALFFNLVKISSIFLFFSGIDYRIVEYYLFISCINIINSLVVIIIIKQSEKYDFIKLFKSIRFTKKYYSLTKKLAYSSLFSTIGYFLFYELDILIIAKMYGAKEVGIYAVCFTFLNFLKTLWNTIFSPYQQRFNHFLVGDSESSFKALAQNLVEYTLPLCFIVITTIFLFIDNLVLLWVGNDFNQSAQIIKILILGMVFNFINHPAKQIFSAKLQYNYIYITGILLPLIFFTCSFILMPYYGILGLAASKIIATFICTLINGYGILKVVNILRILKNWFIQLLITVLFILPVLTSFLLSTLNYNSKNPFQLLILLSGIIIIFTYLIILMTRKKQRTALISILQIK